MVGHIIHRLGSVVHSHEAVTALAKAFGVATDAQNHDLDAVGGVRRATSAKAAGHACHTVIVVRDGCDGPSHVGSMTVAVPGVVVFDATVGVTALTESAYGFDKVITHHVVNEAVVVVVNPVAGNLTVVHPDIAIGDVVGGSRRVRAAQVTVEITDARVRDRHNHAGVSALNLPGQVGLHAEVFCGEFRRVAVKVAPLIVGKARYRRIFVERVVRVDVDRMDANLLDVVHLGIPCKSVHRRVEVDTRVDLDLVMTRQVGVRGVGRTSPSRQELSRKAIHPILVD